MGDLDETVTEAVERAAAAESRLNSIVAILVALGATFMALSNVKDGNIGQAMAQAQSQTLDAWNYYQAKSMKQNLAEATLDELLALKAVNEGRESAVALLDPRIEAARANVARYDKEKNEIKAQAEGYQQKYDELNLHDDQFDLSDAAMSVSIALLGVTALTRKRWLLGVAGVFLSFAVFFGVAGFLGWRIHPDVLMSWLS
jgi:chromosome segregation ATPase